MTDEIDVSGKSPLPPSRWISPLGGMRRSGAWEVPGSMSSFTLVGGVSLDMSDAKLTARETVITKFSLVGGVSIVAPPNARVQVGGFTLLGGRDLEGRTDLPADAPVVRVRAFGLLGGVSVRYA